MTMHSQGPDAESCKKQYCRDGTVDSCLQRYTTETYSNGDSAATAETERTKANRSKTSENEKVEDTNSNSQPEEETIKQGLCHHIVNSFSVPAITLVFTAVIGVFSALLVHHSFVRWSQSDVHDSSKHNYGYSSNGHDEVDRHSYGSPDLLPEGWKQELASRSSRKVSEKEAGGRGEELSGSKASSADFLTTDMTGLRKRTDGEEQYVVAFDAGSTGTRIHVFHFLFQDGNIVLVNEVCEKKKPGLSDYVNDPDQGAAAIQPLIDVAMKTVPRSLHSSTPLVFKATAGLRLLNASGAENLLNKVKERLNTTDFSFNPDDISIMGSIEEGLFGWITINYLLGNLDGNSLTAAALDLGGASVQVTYIPENLRDFSENLERLELLNNGYTLYTQSFLGQGLKAARNATLRDNGNGILTSDCLPVGYSGIFSYSGSNYNIRGPDTPSKDGCWLQVGEFLSSSHMSALWDLVSNSQNPDVYLFSYFYDILQWAGLIDGEYEKVVTVGDYYNAAFQACESHAHPKKPFLCQDLTYITRMLGEMFMLWNKSLHVVSEVNSREASWALGAALNTLSKLQAEKGFP